jgi:hypothetical protein
MRPCIKLWEARNYRVPVLLAISLRLISPLAKRSSRMSSAVRPCRPSLAHCTIRTTIGNLYNDPRRHVRFGSKADVTLLDFDVRFTPESGHCPAQLECLLWAMSGY